MAEVWGGPKGKKQGPARGGNKRGQVKKKTMGQGRGSKI